MFQRILSLRSLAATAALAGLLVIAAGGRAEAQVGTGGTTLLGTGGTTGSTAFATTDFYVTVQQQTNPPVSLTLFELSRFFNQAACDCSTPVNLFISLLQSGLAKKTTANITAGTVYIVLGNGCTSFEAGAVAVGGCALIASEPVLTFLNQDSYTYPTNARTLSTYFNSQGVPLDGGTTTSTGTAAACTSPIGQAFTQTVNFNFDFDDGVGVDLSVPLTLAIDLTPPPPPTGVTIQGGDEALAIHWDAINQSVITDLLGYQILCSRADQYQVFKELPVDGGTSTGPFNSAFQICPTTQAGTGVEGLDPTFVCSGLLSAQATSDRVEILQNGITYAAAVVAVDNSGNPSQPIVAYGTPIKTLSFYDVYRNETPQGGATGGYCAVSTARPRAKTTAAALALFAFGALGVVIARRRRGRR